MDPDADKQTVKNDIKWNNWKCEYWRVLYDMKEFSNFLGVMMVLQLFIYLLLVLGIECRGA